MATATRVPLHVIESIGGRRRSRAYGKVSQSVWEHLTTHCVGVKNKTTHARLAAKLNLGRDSITNATYAARARISDGFMMRRERVNGHEKTVYVWVEKVNDQSN